MGNYRAKYEFPRKTRYEALRNAGYRCERCGEYFERGKGLEAHHIIPIYFAIKNKEFAPAMIKSLENLTILCRSCHELADEENYSMSDDEMRIMAQALLGIQESIW